MVVATFSDFCFAAAECTRNNRKNGWRAGQAVFNLLYVVRPDLAEMVRGSDFDPFHKDENLPDLYDFVARHWEA